MKCFLILLALAGNIWAEALTPDQLAGFALSHNAELRFYEGQVAALPKASQVEVPEIPQPLDFPSRPAFRRAVLDLDRDLARLYLAEFRFFLENEVRLNAMEYRRRWKPRQSRATSRIASGRSLKCWRSVQPPGLSP